MKKYICYYHFFLHFLLSACSDDTEQCLYSPKVFDTGNLLSNKVKEEFLNFDYPAGIVPVLFAADSMRLNELKLFLPQVYHRLMIFIINDL